VKIVSYKKKKNQKNIKLPNINDKKTEIDDNINDTYYSLNQ